MFPRRTRLHPRAPPALRIRLQILFSQTVPCQRRGRTGLPVVQERKPGTRETGINTRKRREKSGCRKNANRKMPHLSERRVWRAMSGTHGTKPTGLMCKTTLRPPWNIEALIQRRDSIVKPLAHIWWRSTVALSHWWLICSRLGMYSCFPFPQKHNDENQVIVILRRRQCRA
jgi:hypothetical protein